MPEVRRRVSPLSVEEYHRLDEYNEHGRRTELIRGIVIEKTSKSPIHATVIDNILDLLRPLLPSGYRMRSEQPLTLADSEPEPDVYVVRATKTILAKANPSTADLVIEVAIHTLALDRELAPVYAEADVKEYWIVIVPQRRVEVYSQPEDGKYQKLEIYTDTQTIACSSITGIKVCVRNLFELTD
jgi:Uma2 family endonuclease